MSEQTAQEPTMEEILASIRRIISEDDAPAETGAAPAAEAPPAPAAEPDVEEPPAYEAPSPALMDEPPSVQAGAIDDDVLELTEPYQEPAPFETVGDLDIAPRAPEAAYEPEPLAPTAYDPDPTDSIISDRVASTAASSFENLSASLLMPREGRTLEDVVKELMRPMLREWLDANLPAIVEAQVQAEVERIARRAR